MKAVAAVRQTTVHNDCPASARATRRQDNNYSKSEADLGLLVLIAVISFVGLLLFAGCYGEQRGASGGAATVPASTQPPAVTEGALALPTRPTACPGWPKRVANLFDQSLSTEQTRTEHPSVADLNPLIDCAAATGGELIAGTIRDGAKIPFARFLGFPPPAAPKPPTFTNNPVMDYDIAAAYAKEVEVYRRTLDAWRKQTDAAIAEFRTAADALLAQPADAPRTALVDAVNRAYLALGESTPYAWLARAPRVLVIVSDGDETASMLVVPPPPQPTTIYAVNGNGQHTDLVHLNPELFVTFDRVVRQLTGGQHVQ
jgi:hypothetical protein